MCFVTCPIRFSQISRSAMRSRFFSSVFKSSLYVVAKHHHSATSWARWVLCAFHGALGGVICVVLVLWCWWTKPTTNVRVCAQSISGTARHASLDSGHIVKCNIYIHTNAGDLRVRSKKRVARVCGQTPANMLWLKKMIQSLLPNKTRLRFSVIHTHTQKGANSWALFLLIARQRRKTADVTFAWSHKCFYPNNHIIHWIMLPQSSA